MIHILPHIWACLNFDKPPSVTDWLEREIILPASMSPRQPGRFSTRDRPQMRPILECAHPSSGVRNITVAAGTQLFKTTLGVLITAYLLKHAPGPMLYVGPSEDFTREEISKKRLRALIEQNHILALEKPYNSDEFQNLHMNMIGMPIDLVGANSPTALAGSTRRYIVIEEASKIQHTEHQDAPEAHPIKNAFERTKDFAGIELRYMSSTPNTPKHIFWQSMLAGSMTTFAVKCPHCGEYFAFEFTEDKEKLANFSAAQESANEASPDHYRSLVWSKDARNANGTWDQDKVIQTARYICPHNGCEIADHEKMNMIRDFEDLHGNTHAPKENRSFRVPSFYSPRIRFGDMAWKFLDRGDLFNTGLQTFFNSWLALPWEEIEAQVREENVLKLRELLDYRRGIIPRVPSGLFITADPGEAQTHWMVAAHYANDEINVIDWGTVVSIEDLQTLPLQLKYHCPSDGKTYSPAFGLVDSGDWSIKVYDMCLNSSKGWFPSKGSGGTIGTWGYTPLRSHPGIDLYKYNDFALKKEFYINRINKLKTPIYAIPRDADQSLIDGHAGQQLISTNGGSEFKKLPKDHFGDCGKLQLLISAIMRARRGGPAPDMPSE